MGSVAAPAVAGAVGPALLQGRLAAAIPAPGQVVSTGLLSAPGAFPLPRVQWPGAAAPAHIVAKREAEAEPEAREDRSLLLGGLLPAAGPVQIAAVPRAVAIAPLCEVKVERQCRKVPVQVPRAIQVPKCASVPRTHCVDTTKVVPGPPACHDEPRQVCNPVERQVPFEVPVEKCTPVASQVCKDVPHKAARQVCKTGYAHGPGYEYGYGTHHGHGYHH